MDPTGIRAWFSRLLAALRRWRPGGSVPRGLSAPAPASRGELPPAGHEDFMARVLLGGAVSDPRADAWLRQLRTDLPFPQPRYATGAAPGTAAEVVARLATLEADVRAAVARAPSDESPESTVRQGDEPDWFVLFADRLLPMAAWFAGVGMPDATASPEWLRELVQRVRRVPGASGAFDRMDERIARLSEHNAGTLAAYFALLKVHLESSLAAAGFHGAQVDFAFPAPGARIADLDPPPAHGSPTSGHVARVLCPAVTVQFTLSEGGPCRTLARGAHVRA